MMRYVVAAALIVLAALGWGEDPADYGPQCWADVQACR